MNIRAVNFYEYIPTMGGEGKRKRIWGHQIQVLQDGKWVPIPICERERRETQGLPGEDGE